MTTLATIEALQQSILRVLGTMDERLAIIQEAITSTPKSDLPEALTRLAIAVEQAVYRLDGKLAAAPTTQPNDHINGRTSA